MSRQGTGDILRKAGEELAAGKLDDVILIKARRGADGRSEFSIDFTGMDPYSAVGVLEQAKLIVLSLQRAGKAGPKVVKVPVPSPGAGEVKH